MTPLKQRNRHNPEEGIYGDCHRACIASMLDLPLDDVPHFIDGWPPLEEVVKREREFLDSQGLVAVMVWFDNLDHVKDFVTRSCKNIYYILCGRSRNGTNHAVIGLNADIVHDPSLDDTGIVGPMDNELYSVTILVDKRFVSKSAMVMSFIVKDLTDKIKEQLSEVAQAV